MNIGNIRRMNTQSPSGQVQVGTTMPVLRAQGQHRKHRSKKKDKIKYKGGRNIKK